METPQWHAAPKTVMSLSCGVRGETEFHALNMKGKHLIIFGMLACAASGLFLLWLLSTPDNEVTAPNKKGNSTDVATGATGKNRKQLTAQEKAAALANFRSRTNLDSMIAQSADKLGATVAAVFISLDDHYLEELKKFPDSKTASCVLACLSQSLDDRLEWARRLKQLDPGGGLGPLMEIRSLILMKQSDKALQLMPELLTKKSLNIPETEILSDIRGAWGTMKFSSDEATSQAMNSGAFGSISSAISGTLQNIWEAQTAIESGQDPIDAAGQQMQLVEMYRNSFRGSLDIEIVAKKMEERILQQLPQDTEYGKENYTVAERLADAKAAHKELSSRIMELGAACEKATPEILGQYQSISFLEGETAGRDWLLRISREQ